MSENRLPNPYAERDDSAFLGQMNELTLHHLGGCPAFARMWPDFTGASSIEELPFTHVGIFKRLDMKTAADGVVFKRAVRSSSTSGVSSRIALDEKSSSLQSESTRLIFEDFIGMDKRPLLIIDSVKSLRSRGDLSARITAAMSLQPLSSDIKFLLEDPEDPASFKWDALTDALQKNDDIIVYGFSWILWLAWGAAALPGHVKEAAKGKKITFVHSGGWKKLEAAKVTSEVFNSALLEGLAPGSSVLDFYGLVEQIGIIYPLCPHGARHVPSWADIIVRDSLTLRPLADSPGQLQLLNSITFGSPSHSVLTEDIGRLLPGDCPCGRRGKRFELLGRIPKAEVRGCANV